MARIGSIVKWIPTSYSGSWLMDMIPTKKNRSIRSDVPLDQKLVFTLDIKTEDDRCEFISGIPKENGLHSQGIG
jgi:hypothetical protein